jgi:hypothetical protein
MFVFKQQVVGTSPLSHIASLRGLSETMSNLSSLMFVYKGISYKVIRN